MAVERGLDGSGADLRHRGFLGENPLGDGLNLIGVHVEKVIAGLVGGGDVVVKQQAFAGPGGVGGGGFEGELRLGDGEALGAFQLAGARAVRCEIGGFAEDGFERFGAGIGIEASGDLEGAGFVEEAGFRSDLVAEAALLAQLGEKPGGGGLTKNEREQAEGVALRGMAAGGVPGDGELKLIGGAGVGDPLSGSGGVG